jgi:hypothetical protein
VKQALYQLSDDPDGCRLYSFHQQIFAIFRKLAKGSHCLRRVRTCRSLESRRVTILHLVIPYAIFNFDFIFV